MTRKIFGFIFVIILGGMGLTGLNANENMHYGYISYLDGNAKVVRLDGSQAKGIINLPLVPGDKIITGESDRCEIQFDNGTVMRLDKNTVLGIETILAQSLTSSRKLTTLYLDQGEIYAIVKSYKRENFQVITDNAAVLMNSNSLNTVHYDVDQGTSIYVERGKVKVLYGSEARKVKWETVKRKKGFRVTPSHQLVEGLKRDMEFVFWNEKINKNHRELHYGVSRVPKPVYKYSKGIVEFAQKWSTLYGEWIYDDIFGYVWRPYEKQFAYSQRPFYHAQYVNVNGQLFLVPSQRWGWAPAHLGTWVWMNKRGWVWIPGDSFSTGVGNNIIGFFNMARFYMPYVYWASHPPWGMSYYRYTDVNDFPSYSYWIDQVYRSSDNYKLYRTDPDRFYQSRINSNNPGKKRKISLKGVPKHIKKIIKRMNKTPLSTLEEKLFGTKGSGERHIVVPGVRRLGELELAPVVVRPAGRSISSPDKLTSRKAADFRTWCPDKNWGRRHRVKVEYSSRANAVICRELGLDSNHMSLRQRISLRHAPSSRLVPGGLARTTPAGSYYSPVSGSTGTSSHAGTTRTSSGGSKGGKKSK